MKRFPDKGYVVLTAREVKAIVATASVMHKVAEVSQLKNDSALSEMLDNLAHDVTVNKGRLQIV